MRDTYSMADVFPFYKFLAGYHRVSFNGLRRSDLVARRSGLCTTRRCLVIQKTPSLEIAPGHYECTSEEILCSC